MSRLNQKTQKKSYCVFAFNILPSLLVPEYTKPKCFPNIKKKKEIEPRDDGNEIPFQFEKCQVREAKHFNN